MGLFHNFKMSWYRVFQNPGDPLMKSRRAVYAGNLCSTVTTAVTGGIFYSAIILVLFQGHPESLRNEYLGNIAMLQTSAGFLQMVAPQIIERIRNRKLYAMILRWISHFLNIVCLSLIPLLPLEIHAKASLFMVVAGLASVCSALQAPALSSWHIYSVPEEVRSDYFAISNILSLAAAHLTNLSAGAFMDFCVENDKQLAAVLIMRGVALMSVTVESVSWWRVAEPDYATAKKKQSVLEILLVPFRYPMYLLNALAIGLWTCFYLGMTSYYDTYLIADAKLSYTLKSGCDALSVIMSVIFMPIWNQIVRRFGWLRPMALSLGLLGCIYGLNVFVTEETQWVYLLSTVTCQVIVGGYSLGMANFPYMNAPKEGMSSCLAFYSTFVSLMGFAGTWVSREFMRLTDGKVMKIFGLTIKNGAYISLIPFFGSFLVVALICFSYHFDKKKKAAEAPALSA